MRRALGIDVGVTKGLDAVVLGADLGVVAFRRGLDVGDVPALIAEWRPDVVAIDSPPAWATEGRSRRAERDLLRLGIHSFATPVAAVGETRRFYEWMRVGFRVFRAAEAQRFSGYRRGAVDGTAIEVFPHACAVALAGALRPSGMAKGAWRRSVLHDAGVRVDELRSVDQVDAALAALTGLRALEGVFCAIGEPAEGVVVLPVREALVRYRPGVAARHPIREG